MNLYQATASELEALSAKGANWLVIAAYSFGLHERKDVLSWHKTREAAGRKYRSNERVAIVDIADAIEEARYNDTAR